MKDNFLVRQAKCGELKEIIKVANKAFEPVRYKSYDFKKTMPKIYNTKHDYSAIHHIVENKNGKMVSVSGNLIRNIEIEGEKYPFSMVGTVSTIPEYQNNGFMKMLMMSTEYENREKVVFSCLTGERQRYNFFGYENGGYQCIYTFNNYFLKHHDENNIKICEHNVKNESKMFDLYKENQIFNLRNKSTFVESIKACKNTIYDLIWRNKFAGYFVEKEGQIIEIYVTDFNLLEGVIIEILKKLNQKEVKFFINPLNINLKTAFDKIAQHKQLKERIMFKIYKLDKFVEMLLKINQKIKKLNKTKEIYKIEDEIIEIDVDEKISVKKLNNRKNIKENFNQQDFIKYILGMDSYLNNNSKIFPVAFDINICDSF